MPDAVCVPDPPWRLSARHGGLRNARASPWRILRRLLLGTDDTVVRGRRDEPALDRPPRVTHSLGEGYFFRPPDCARCGRRVRRGRCMVVVNGNILMIVRFKECSFLKASIS